MSEQSKESRNDGKPMLPAVLPLNAEWRDDCQGKKDYDGEILRISTRYWGSRDYRIVGGNLTKPSAKSSLMLSYRANDELPTYDPGYINLVEQEFEAETEAEVKALVEAWAQQKMNEVVQLLMDKFQPGHGR